MPLRHDAGAIVNEL
jgi:hypothetical protein